jgi:hypothetical protein
MDRMLDSLYRIKQDQLYQSDFDRMLLEMENDVDKEIEAE